ncbi:hypothetical protein L9F63_021610, partial [Diploptera punctata]
NSCRQNQRKRQNHIVDKSRCDMTKPPNPKRFDVCDIVIYSESILRRNLASFSRRRCEQYDRSMGYKLYTISQRSPYG